MLRRSTVIVVVLLLLLVGAWALFLPVEPDVAVVFDVDQDDVVMKIASKGINENGGAFCERDRGRRADL